ncbi:MAG: hypothetical protein KF684_12705 [Phycisphaeraceae bacterium]|nr:hypothetical protein [Phycisphaeraceae bacterium]
MQPHHRTMIGVALFALLAAMIGAGALLLRKAMAKKRLGERQEAQSLVLGAMALLFGAYIVLRVAIGVVSEG